MNYRDVELLSAYLDGQLSPSDSARLQKRLTSEPGLASTLESLRESQTLLRRLPHRRAPRNFLLTPKMVEQKPPLPRSYPVFRFATALATLLFALSLVTNQVGRMTASAPAAPQGIGGGSDMATEAPALMQPALEMPPEAPSTEPPIMMESAPTGMAQVMPLSTPTPEPAHKNQERTLEQPAASTSAKETVQPLLTSWQMTFLILALLGALCMFLIQRLAVRKWRSK